MNIFLQVFTSIASAVSAIFAIYSVVSSARDKRVNIQVVNPRITLEDNYLVCKMTINNLSSLPISITSIDLTHLQVTYQCSIESVCYNRVTYYEGDRLVDRCVSYSTAFPLYVPSFGSSSCCVVLSRQDIVVNLDSTVTLSMHTNRNKIIGSRLLHIHH